MNCVLHTVHSFKLIPITWQVKGQSFGRIEPITTTRAFDRVNHSQCTVLLLLFIPHWATAHSRTLMPINPIDGFNIIHHNPTRRASFLSFSHYTVSPLLLSLDRRLRNQNRPSIPIIAHAPTMNPNRATVQSSRLNSITPTVQRNPKVECEGPPIHIRPDRFVKVGSLPLARRPSRRTPIGTIILHRKYQRPLQARAR